MFAKFVRQAFRFNRKAKTINKPFTGRTIINPISKERIAYIEQRTRVIEACLQTGFSHMSVLPPGGQRNDMQAALAKLSVERTEMQIEHHVLTTVLVKLTEEKTEAP